MLTRTRHYHHRSNAILLTYLRSKLHSLTVKSDIRVDVLLFFSNTAATLTSNPDFHDVVNTSATSERKTIDRPA